jgi:acetyl-CoA synthetase
VSRETIEKPGPWPVRPNLLDYRRTCAEFSWSSARAALDGLPGGRGLNIAHEAVDRHAAGPLHDRVALRFLSGDGGGRRDLTYAQLAEATSRFANVLRSLGVGKGDRVFSLLGRVPELYVAALGALKNGSVFCPLFSAFGPEPIRARLALGGGKVIATTESLARRKLGSVRAALPALEHVLVLGDHEPSIAGGRALAPLLGRAPSTFDIPATAPEDVALLHFTSGTTGRPKGAMHVHEAVVAHEVTGRLALDLHEEDVFWCTADPGWVTGTSCGKAHLRGPT